MGNHNKSNRMNCVCIKLITVIACISISTTATSQQFITKGKIEFERKTNQHAFMDENNMWDAMAKKTCLSL